MGTSCTLTKFNLATLIAPRGAVVRGPVQCNVGNILGAGDFTISGGATVSFDKWLAKSLTLTVGEGCTVFCGTGKTGRIINKPGQYTV